LGRGDHEGGNESRERRSRHEAGESSEHHEQSESNDLMDEIERELESEERRTTDADELMDDIVRELEGGSETEKLMDEIERDLEGEQEAKETAEAERLMDEVERELEDDRETVERAEDRLDEFEEDILENFEKYGIDGDEVRERWRERFAEDVEEELERDSASDQPDESVEVSGDAADSEMTETAESYSYSESGDGTVQVLKTEERSETTESIDESKEHNAEMEPQSESNSHVEGEKNRAVEEGNQKEDLESPEAEKQIAHETESEASESSAQHELKRASKESAPETSEDARARQQISETVSESSDEKAEAAERKEAQAESTELHSARVECEELTEEEVEGTRTEYHLNESDEIESEATQDSGSELMQEWAEDGETEELADSEHLEEPDSTQSILESYQEVLEENISPDTEELDEDEEVDERVVSDDERPTGMLDSPYPNVYADETGFFAETEEQRWRRKLIELYNELPEEMKQLYRELVKAMLESEEGLENLLNTFPELGEQEEFEEKHEDAIEYVKFRQKLRELVLLGTLDEVTVEELALELDVDQETVEKWLNDDYYSFPKLIQQVWHQEIERRWGNVLRAIANRDVPYDMSEVNETLKRFPELKSDPHFELHYNEVKAWTEVMAAKRQDKIATLIIQGMERFKVAEVKELAKRLNLTVDKAVRWLRDEDRPRLVDVLAEKNEIMKEYDEKVVTAQDDSHHVLSKRRAVGIMQAPDEVSNLTPSEQHDVEIDKGQALREKEEGYHPIPRFHPQFLDSASVETKLDSETLAPQEIATLDFETALARELIGTGSGIHDRLIEILRKDPTARATIEMNSAEVQEDNGDLRVLLLEATIEQITKDIGLGATTVEEAFADPELWQRVKNYWKTEVLGSLFRKYKEFDCSPSTKCHIAVNLAELDIVFTERATDPMLNTILDFVRILNDREFSSKLTYDAGRRGKADRTGNTLYLLKQITEVFRITNLDGNQTHPNRFVDTIMQLPGFFASSESSDVYIDPASVYDEQDGAVLEKQLFTDYLHDTVLSGIKWFSAATGPETEIQPGNDVISDLKWSLVQDQVFAQILLFLKALVRTDTTRKLAYLLIPGRGSFLGSLSEDEKPIIYKGPQSINTATVNVAAAKAVGQPIGLVVNIETGSVDIAVFSERMLRMLMARKTSVPAVEFSAKSIEMAHDFLGPDQWTQAEHDYLKKLVDTRPREYRKGLPLENQERNPNRILQTTINVAYMLESLLMGNTTTWRSVVSASEGARVKLLSNIMEGDPFIRSYGLMLSQALGMANQEALRNTPRRFAFESNALRELNDIGIASDQGPFIAPRDRIRAMASPLIEVEGTIDHDLLSKIEPFLDNLRMLVEEGWLKALQTLSHDEGAGEAITKLSRALYRIASSAGLTEDIRRATWERLHNVKWIDIADGTAIWTRDFVSEEPNREWLRLRCPFRVGEDVFDTISSRYAEGRKIAKVVFFEDLHLEGFRKARTPDGGFTWKPAIDLVRKGVQFIDSNGSIVLSVPLSILLEDIPGNQPGFGGRGKGRTEEVLFWLSFLKPDEIKKQIPRAEADLKQLTELSRKYFTAENFDSIEGQLSEIMVQLRQKLNTTSDWKSIVDIELAEEVLMAARITTGFHFTPQFGMPAVPKGINYAEALAHTDMLGIPITRAVSYVSMPLESMISELQVGIFLSSRVQQPVFLSRTGHHTPDLIMTDGETLRIVEAKTTATLSQGDLSIDEFMASRQLVNRPSLLVDAYSEQIENGEDVVLSIPLEIMNEQDELVRKQLILTIKPPLMMETNLERCSARAAAILLQFADKSLYRVISFVGKTNAVNEPVVAQGITELVKKRNNINCMLTALAKAFGLKRSEYEVYEGDTLVWEYGNAFNALLSAEPDKRALIHSILDFFIPNEETKANIRAKLTGDSS